ncbi:MAG: hypothetical protein MJ160_07575 [Treponema sp.]|nr:hypothetical protein [Treponema sp.]
MAITVKDFAMGRKTFFITPDLSLFPETYLEDYFSFGYECYFVENSKIIPLKEKIEIMIQIFHDIILIFNIDYNVEGINWAEYISELQKKYGDRVAIGVTFVKRADKDAKRKLEKMYLFDIGITCGCIQLEYQKSSNFIIIQKMLNANQAQGRRKNIRALCTKAYTFSFTYKGVLYNGTLQDISLSHFSFIFQSGKLPIKDYEKIDEVTLHLKGLFIKSGAVLMMERASGENILFVFAFVTENGMNGLNDRYRQLIIPNMYQLMSSNCKNLMDKVISSRSDENMLSRDVDDMEINL